MRVRMGVGMRVTLRVIQPVLVFVPVFVPVRQVNIKFHPLDSHLLPSRNVEVISIHSEFAQLALELCGIHPEVD